VNIFVSKGLGLMLVYRSNVLRKYFEKLIGKTAKNIQYLYSHTWSCHKSWCHRSDHNHSVWLQVYGGLL